MSEVQITNGTVKYGETRKIADFESKTGHVELSFNIAEGQDADEAISFVSGTVKRHLAVMLGGEATTVAPKTATAKPTKEKAPPKMPAATTPAAEDDFGEMPPVPESLKKPPKAEAPVDDGIDDLLGEAPVVAKKEVTDKELNDHLQKWQATNKNAPAVRKLLTELGVKSPPGRVIDLPQDKRQDFLDKLKEIKPLA